MDMFIWFLKVYPTFCLQAYVWVVSAVIDFVINSLLSAKMKLEDPE